MTENLAGRGEGLAGLVAKWREIGKKYLGPPLKLKTRDETMVMAGIEKAAQAVYVICADQLEIALEAAAPAGTAPRVPVRHIAQNIVQRLKDNLSNTSTYKHMGPAIWEQIERFIVQDFDDALATPSPQAPLEQK